MKGFSGLEVGTYVERVLLALVLQGRFTLFEGRMEERITIGCEDNLVGLEVERNGADVLSRNRKAIDYAISDVLISHGLNHAGNDDGTGYVVAAKVVGSMAFVQQSLNLLGTHGSQLCFIGFGIVVVLTSYQALAVANHPDFATQTTKDNDGTGETVFRVLGQPLKH